MIEETITLEEMLTKYRDLRTEFAPALAAMSELEGKIKAHVRETGETLVIDGASVTARPGAKRATWDGKALDNYLMTHPEILAFKRESVTAPVVTIKVEA
jgi:hypothetical protein